MKKQNPNAPLDFVVPIQHIYDTVLFAERDAGDQIAYTFKDPKDPKKINEVTFKNFAEDVRGFGSALAEIGADTGHIAIVADNSYRWIVTYLTSICSKGVFFPIDKQLPEDQLLNVLQKGDATAIICSKKFQKFFSESREKLPQVKTYIAIDADEDSADYLSFNKLLSHGKELVQNGFSAYTKDLGKGDIDQMKVLTFTSGTTGLAKGVMLSERNLMGIVYYGQQIARVYTKGLSVLPYHHSYEMVAGILVSLHKHANLCINESLAMVLKNLSFYQPDYVYLVPAFLDLFYKKIVQTMKEQGKYEKFQKGVKISAAMRKIGIDLRPKLFKDIHKVFGGKLRKIVVGGAPLRPDTAKFFDDVGIFVTNGYGITECSPLVSVNRDEFCDNLTVGVKIPCVEVKIENPGEDGNGEILVKGDTVMLGYYKMPEETAQALKDGWFHTGDLGNINALGQISITGRAKNLVVLDNGKNVYPEEVENYIMLLPYVKEAVVSGVDDGEKIILQAEVFLDKDAVQKMKDAGEEAPDEAKILADARKALEPLPSYKRVSRVVIRDTEFTKTTTNKIKRNYH